MEDLILEDINISILEKVYTFLEKNGNKDPEHSHIIESEVKNLTIKKISLGNTPNEESIEMCKILQKITDLEYPRWFG